MNTQLTTSENEIVRNKGDHIEVSAKTPEEMEISNKALIQWCDHKMGMIRSDANELKESYEHAVKNRWKSSTLKRHWQLAEKRIDFFRKIKKALELGYIIVPNFPVTVFAIRTDRSYPLKMFSTSQWDQHIQSCQVMKEGEGIYKNPFPEIYQRDISSSEDKAKGKKTIQYYAENWKDLDFPITMAKPKIMEATNRTMALKLFDDLGVLPSPYRKVDPLIVARIKDPRSTQYNQKFVSFIVAWHLDTETL